MDEHDLAVKQYLLAHRNDVVTPEVVSQETGMPPGIVSRGFEKMLALNDLKSLGDDRYIFADDSDEAAFTILASIAPNISLDEYRQHKDQPHLLVALSREREIGRHTRAAKELEDAIKSKGQHIEKDE